MGGRSTAGRSQGGTFGPKLPKGTYTKQEIDQVLSSVRQTIKDYKSQLKNLSDADRINEKAIIKDQAREWGRYAKEYAGTDFEQPFTRISTDLSNLYRSIDRDRKLPEAS